MSMALERLCLVEVLAMPTAVELSQMTFVGCWLCPSSSSVVRVAAPSLAFINIAPSSASAAEDITFFRIFAIAKIGPLIGVMGSLLLKKKWLPYRLLPSGSPKYDTSE